MDVSGVGVEDPWLPEVAPKPRYLPGLGFSGFRSLGV